MGFSDNKLLETEGFSDTLLQEYGFLPGGSGFQPRISQWHHAAVVYRGWKPLPQR